MLFKTYKIKKLTKKIAQLKNNRQHNQVSDDLLKKEIKLCIDLALVYQAMMGKKKYPHAQIQMLEAYRAAATLSDAASLYLLGKYYIEEGKIRAKLQDEVALASEMNLKIKCAIDEEGIAYLQNASKFEHVQARRYLGLCYINGWGVAADKDKGFDLVVESIDLENSWDKVPQIFAAIGLNKPEFFTALSRHTKRAR